MDLNAVKTELLSRLSGIGVFQVATVTKENDRAEQSDGKPVFYTQVRPNGDTVGWVNDKTPHLSVDLNTFHNESTKEILGIKHAVTSLISELEF